MRLPTWQLLRSSPARGPGAAARCGAAAPCRSRPRRSATPGRVRSRSADRARARWSAGSGRSWTGRLPARPAGRGRRRSAWRARWEAGGREDWAGRSAGRKECSSSDVMTPRVAVAVARNALDSVHRYCKYS